MGSDCLSLFDVSSLAHWNQSWNADRAANTTPLAERSEPARLSQARSQKDYRMDLPDFIRAFPAIDLPLPPEKVTTSAMRTADGLAVFFSIHAWLQTAN